MFSSCFGNARWTLHLLFCFNGLTKIKSFFIIIFIFIIPSPAHSYCTTVMIFITQHFFGQQLENIFHFWVSFFKIIIKLKWIKFYFLISNIQNINCFNFLFIQNMLIKYMKFQIFPRKQINVIKKIFDRKYIKHQTIFLR